MKWRGKMYLGKNIQYLRKQRKITQEGFSEQMGVSRQTVAKWEAGDAIPELEKLLEICDFFFCKLDELVRKSLSDNDVNRDIKTSGSTSIGQLIEILDKYEIRHAERNIVLFFLHNII